MEYVGCKNYFACLSFFSLPLMVAKGQIKTTINLDSEVYSDAKARAEGMGVTFGELVELSLKRDQSEKMAILRTEGKIVYAPIVEEKSSPVDEMVRWLDESLAKLRSRGDFGAAFHVDVARDIAGDIARWRDAIIRQQQSMKNAAAMKIEEREGGHAGRHPRDPAEHTPLANIVVGKQSAEKSNDKKAKGA